MSAIIRNLRLLNLGGTQPRGLQPARPATKGPTRRMRASGSVRAIARMRGGDTFARSQSGVTTVGLTLGPVA